MQLLGGRFVVTFCCTQTRLGLDSFHSNFSSDSTGIGNFMGNGVKRNEVEPTQQMPHMVLFYEKLQILDCYP